MILDLENPKLKKESTNLELSEPMLSNSNALTQAFLQTQAKQIPLKTIAQPLSPHDFSHFQPIQDFQTLFHIELGTGSEFSKYLVDNTKPEEIKNISNLITLPSPKPKVVETNSPPFMRFRSLLKQNDAEIHLSPKENSHSDDFASIATRNINFVNKLTDNLPKHKPNALTKMLLSTRFEQDNYSKNLIETNGEKPKITEIKITKKLNLSTLFDKNNELPLKVKCDQSPKLQSVKQNVINSPKVVANQKFKLSYCENSPKNALKMKRKYSSERSNSLQSPVIPRREIKNVTKRVIQFSDPFKSSERSLLSKKSKIIESKINKFENPEKVYKRSQNEADKISKKYQNFRIQRRILSKSTSNTSISKYKPKNLPHVSTFSDNSVIKPNIQTTFKSDSIKTYKESDSNKKSNQSIPLQKFLLQHSSTQNKDDSQNIHSSNQNL